ncbi:unnamed protein product, partial [Rotaria magnacalcarata]
NNAPSVIPLTWEDLVGVQEEHQKQRRPQYSSYPFELDEIRQIIGKPINSLDDVGYYSQNDHTWRWNDIFWFSLTPLQHDQLNRLLQSRSRQDSGDTQINEHSDRSAYQGDSEDNTPKFNINSRRIRSQNSSEENLAPTTITRTIIEETKRVQSTINDPGLTVSVTGAGAWQQQKQPTASTGIGKYTETSTIHENHPSISVFGSTPNGNYARIGSQESIASSTIQPQSFMNKKSDNQMTIIESGYNSADEPLQQQQQQQQQQRTNLFRPNSSTIFEESSTSQHMDIHSGIAGLVAGPSSVIVSSDDIQLQEQPIYENLRPELIRQQLSEPDLDPLSYEQFIFDYFSTYAKRLRSNEKTLILIIDGQQIQMPHIRVPTNDSLVLSRNVYLDAIDEYPPPFETESDQLVIFIHDGQILKLAPRSTIIEEQQIDDDNDDNIEIDEDDDILIQWLSDNARWSTENGQVFLLRYRTMPNYLVRITGDEGLRLSNLLHRQTLHMNDLLDWHKKHVQIERIDNSLRMIIKPNRNIEIDSLPLDENEKKREKVKSTNQKTRNTFEQQEEKPLVFFIPFHQQTQNDNEEEKEEEEEKNNYQHYTSTSSLLQQEEQKKIKTNDSDEERALFLESISSLLHFVNANGSNVGTLELIQGRRLRLSLTNNSPFSQQQQQLEFNEEDTRLLYEELNLDIDACAEHLIDLVFDRIEFDNDKQHILIYYHNQMLKLKNFKQKLLQPATKKLRLTSNKTSRTESPTRTSLNEEHVNTLTQWLDQLNRQGLITITEQNDIVVLPNGEDDQQQILINHDDVDKYMEQKLSAATPGDEAEVIVMNDIARILLLYKYVHFSEGQLIFGSQRIALDRNELLWLRSIIRGVRMEELNRETAIDLFDGENTQALHIPYEHMPPTNDPYIVANYLYQNGSV